MKVWITKYALTKGVEEREGEISACEPEVFTIKTGWGFAYYHRGEWYRTEEEAKKRAEEMRLAKLASLRKQISKLEGKKF